MYPIPYKFLTSKYRYDMWRNVSRVLRKIEKALPITHIYLLGSFMSKKRRPADVDCMVLIRVKNKRSVPWSLDFVIVPDGSYGDGVVADARKWMKQKYGAKKSAFIKLK
mgnify:CR=1 FL=1